MVDKVRIRVVAAEITQIVDGVEHFLITQRNPHAVLPLLWEFPGGKVEHGETDAEALRRELREEMDLEIEVLDETMAIERDYETYAIDFHVYRARIVAGAPKAGRVHDVRWVRLQDMCHYEFPPVDRQTVARLLGLVA